MKLLTAGKPEKAADSDRNARPILQHPYLDTERKALYATTPYLAVRLPVEIEDGDTSGPITKDALAAARKSPLLSIVIADSGLTVHGKDGPTTFPRPDFDGSLFPIVEQVLPADHAGDFTVALDPKQLLAIAEAMGASIVRLQFGGPLAPIRVTPVVFEGTTPEKDQADRFVGALMPYRVP